MVVLQVLEPEAAQVALVLDGVFQPEVVHYDVLHARVVRHRQAELLVNFHCLLAIFKQTVLNIASVRTLPPHNIAATKGFGFGSSRIIASRTDCLSKIIMRPGSSVKAGEVEAGISVAEAVAFVPGVAVGLELEFVIELPELVVLPAQRPVLD